MVNSIQFEDSKILFAGATDTEIAFHKDCCCSPPVPCAQCLTGYMPGAFRLEVPVPVDDGCADCEDAAGEYDLTVSGCGALGFFSAICGVYMRTYQILVYSDATDYIVDVKLAYIGGSNRGVRFRKNYGSITAPPDNRPDCQSFNEEVIPYDTDYGVYATPCDFTGLSVLLTAL